MGPYSSGDKSIKISYDFQEKDKELDSQELPLSPLPDLYWPLQSATRCLGKLRELIRLI